jgi:hypothetical protein
MNEKTSFLLVKLQRFRSIQEHIDNMTNNSHSEGRTNLVSHF